MEELHAKILICPRCGKKASEFNEQGKHNFCPTLEGGKAINICMDCKVKEILLSWK